MGRQGAGKQALTRSVANIQFNKGGRCVPRCPSRQPRELQDPLIFVLRCAFFSATIDIVRRGCKRVVLFHSFAEHLTLLAADTLIKML